MGSLSGQQEYDFLKTTGSNPNTGLEQGMIPALECVSMPKLAEDISVAGVCLPHSRLSVHRRRVQCLFDQGARNSNQQFQH